MRTKASTAQRAETRPTARATRTVVATFGVLAALAGIEHGIGEILQGPVRPAGLRIESWPDSPAMEVLAGEPAMTVVPNLLLTGILAVVVAVALGIWSVRHIERRHGRLVLVALSVLLLAVGGGFGPPLVGLACGVGALRMGTVARRGSGSRWLANLWPCFLAAGVIGFAGLMPGLVVLDRWIGVPDGLVYGFGFVAFGGLVMALAAARASDGRVADGPDGRVAEGPDGRGPAGRVPAGPEGQRSGFSHVSTVSSSRSNRTSMAR